MFSKKPTVEPGSRVAYRKEFLKSINLEAGEFSGARGTVTEVVNDIAVVNFDNAEPRRVNRENLRVVA